ncbi:hypothetical protein Deipr_2640 (plasmid) [Deinococcus proteolyticus MRP]|uniref:Uncharacterized protein n=1 Tax=Deinococcus proteolyticus (strain ATCC 35074 / DSM 20540 / JCM 6276 / NBRC 101906 / NCIMB 13154 / VKM Ac-1939 / CCM 2703 / MRP) TaxID=693977 RepID=F0RR42_DEIPM|nr:hypothetical protein Deipr_2640 [Deinococcus proteolyticus MRP]
MPWPLLLFVLLPGTLAGITHILWPTPYVPVPQLEARCKAAAEKHLGFVLQTDDLRVISMDKAMVSRSGGDLNRARQLDLVVRTPEGVREAHCTSTRPPAVSLDIRRPVPAGSGLQSLGSKR